MSQRSRGATAGKRKADYDSESVIKKPRVDEGSEASGSKKPRRNKKVLLDLFIAGVDKDAAVIVFGEGEMGELGLGPDDIEKARPCLMPEIKGVGIAAGGIHSLVIDSTRKTLLSFGCNDEGALGRKVSQPDSNDDAVSEYYPGTVVLNTGDSQIAMISAGDCHSAALLTDGTVFIWGAFRDSHGTLGLIDAEEITKEPKVISFLGKIVKIASGSNHLVALSESGEVFTVGSGEQGQLGRLSQRRSDRNSRVGIDGLLKPDILKIPRKNKICDIWAGGYSTIAKDHQGNVFVCGLNNYSQLGLEKRNDEDTCLFWPIKNEVLSKISLKKVCPSDHHSVVLSSEGKVYTMGRHNYGRLGLGEDGSDACQPTLVPALSDKQCIDIACGSATTYALTSSGDVYSCGMSGSQLGLGNQDSDVFVPTKVPGAVLKQHSATAISASGQHVIMLADQKQTED